MEISPGLSDGSGAGGGQGIGATPHIRGPPLCSPAATVDILKDLFLSAVLTEWCPLYNLSDHIFILQCHLV